MSVYFVRFGTRIKIGKSRDPWSRVRQLQTGTPVRLELLAVAPVVSDAESYEIERLLHEQFSWARGRGEFFTYHHVLKQLVAAVATGMPIKKAMAECEPVCKENRRRKAALFAAKLHTPPHDNNRKARKKKAKALGLTWQEFNQQSRT